MGNTGVSSRLGGCACNPPSTMRHQHPKSCTSLPATSPCRTVHQMDTSDPTTLVPGGAPCIRVGAVKRESSACLQVCLSWSNWERILLIVPPLAAGHADSQLLSAAPDPAHDWSSCCCGAGPHPTRVCAGLTSYPSQMRCASGPRAGGPGRLPCCVYSARAQAC